MTATDTILEAGLRTAPQHAPQAGTYGIDPSHSSVEFTVRHAMIAKIRGSFDRFGGLVSVDENLEASAVRASIEMASVNTNDEQRDNHLRSADFFNVDRFPTMEFTSTAVRRSGDGWKVDGDLNLHGVTRPVELELEYHGSGGDPYGNTRAGFTATTELNRKDFGLRWNVGLEAGGVLVGDKVNVTLEISAILER